MEKVNRDKKFGGCVQLDIDYIDVNQEQWNREYEEGQWEYLSNVDEMSRYSIISGYIRKAKLKDKILDVGCGAGELWNYLTEEDKERYWGVDISSVAIERASIKSSHFIEADINNYYPSETFDCIVLNEVLYYIKNPLQLINKLLNVLNSEGIMVISMFLYPDKEDGEYKIVKGIIEEICNNKKIKVFDHIEIEEKMEWERRWEILVIQNKK